jgi:hypothetical protein
VQRRFAPHQRRHAHAVELAREGVPLKVIQRQLGHANLGTTSIYLQGIDTEEIIATVHAQARTDDVRQRRTAALINPSPNSGGAAHVPAGRTCWVTASRSRCERHEESTRPAARARTSSRRARRQRGTRARSFANGGVARLMHTAVATR